MEHGPINDHCYEMTPFQLCKSDSILLVQNTFPLTDIGDNCANNADLLLPSGKERGSFEKRSKKRNKKMQQMVCKACPANPPSVYNVDDKLK